MDDSITIAAVGDVNLADYIRPQTALHGPLWAFESCLPALKAELLFGNLECVTFRPPWPQEPANIRESFHLPWSEARGLAQAGFSVVNLANNHILDYGPDRAMETIAFCETHGIAPIGFGRDQVKARQPAIFDRHGVRVAFLAYVEDVPSLNRQITPGPAYACEPNIVEDIAAARSAGADIVVVSLHADMEFADYPAPHRVALSRRLIGAGADILLGHHPHVPQGIEEYHGGLIVYSLGDFVFPVAGDPYLEGGSPWTDKSFILRIRVSRTGYQSHEIVPVKIESRGRPVPMSHQEAAELLARHRRLSRDLSDPAVLEHAWGQTARRWWRTNLQWLAAAAKEKGIEEAAAHFLKEFFYDENRPWVTRVLRDLATQLPGRMWEGPSLPDQPDGKVAAIAQEA